LGKLKYKMVSMFQSCILFPPTEYNSFHIFPLKEILETRYEMVAGYKFYQYKNTLRITTTWWISKSNKFISQEQLLSWKSNRMIHGLYHTAVLLEAYIVMGWRRCFKCKCLATITIAIMQPLHDNETTDWK